MNAGVDDDVGHAGIRLANYDGCLFSCFKKKMQRGLIIRKKCLESQEPRATCVCISGFVVRLHPEISPSSAPLPLMRPPGSVGPHFSNILFCLVTEFVEKKKRKS